MARSFDGQGLGVPAEVVGELVFNTAMTGYQEILTDPSYAGQLITFTFPHVGNVGTNEEDLEATTCWARGLRAARADHRAVELPRRAASRPLAGAAGAGRHRRHRHPPADPPPAHRPALRPQRSGSRPSRARIMRVSSKLAREWPGLVGMDLASEVSCRQRYGWRGGLWHHPDGYAEVAESRYHVVAVDYGIKRNILRSLARLGLRVSVVPATTSAEEILALRPDGIFLSNGPGDPAATGAFAVPEIRKLVDSGKPLFGICLGHQMLALALGGRHREDEVRPSRRQPPGQGPDHRQGRDHEPEPRLRGARPRACRRASRRPMSRCSTARSRAWRCSDRPVFSVQYHPEASPGPQDSAYLFDRFVQLIERSS